MPASVDAYIAGFPPPVADILERIRATIHAQAPDVTEVIKYSMAAFLLDGAYVVYLAGWKKHVALYPIPAGTPALQKALAAYRDEKSTLRFPLDKPIPYPLIRRIVRARFRELRT